MAGITALIGTVKSLTSAMNTAIHNYSHFESMQKGLETFFQDADKGKQKFEELRKLSNSTTFGVDELTDSFTQLANVGVDVDTIKDKLVMLGNAAQGNKTKFAELVSIYSKIQSTGKAGAMQLQQLAMRGLPIYDVLKKIGVQGTATGEDITKAFQMMTQEGGQFYNAMNNINDTIEGKEGFISDYFKEMTVNFVEITGIADAYKKALDILKEAIGAISDKLLEWNENPFMKALVRGVFVGLISAIATCIAANLIPKLVAVISNLTTINILSGPKGWATLAVAGIAIAGSALASYNSKIKETEKHANELAETLEKVGKVQNPTERNRKSMYEEENALLQSYQESYKNSSDRLKELEEQRDKLIADMKKFSGNFFDESLLSENEDLKEINGEIDRLNKGLELGADLIKSQTERVEMLNTEIKKIGKFGDLKNTVSALYENTKTKNQQELEQLYENLKTLEEYKAFDNTTDNDGTRIVFDEKQKKEIDELADYLQKKINDVKLKITLEGMDEWQKALQKALGLDDKTTASLVGKHGDKWVEEYLSRQQKLRSQQQSTYALMGMNQSTDEKTNIANQAKELLSVIDTLIKTGRFGVDAAGKLDNTFTKLKSSLDDLQEEFINSEGTLEEWNEILGNLKVGNTSFIENIENWTTKQIKEGNVGGSIAGKFVGDMLSSSQDVQNFASGFATGGVIGGITNAVGGALSTVAKEVEGMDKVINPLTDAMRSLTPLFELFVGVMKPLFTMLDGIKNVLSAIVEGILRPFEPLIRFIAEAFSKLANLFTKLFDSLNPIIDVINMIVDTILNAIDAILEPLLQGFQVVGEFLQVFTEIAKPVIAVINLISAVIKALSAPLRLLVKLLTRVVEAINNFFGPFIEKIEKVIERIDKFLGYEKEIDEQKESELERLRALNEEYKNLYSAMKEQEEYYLNKKMEVNAGTYKDKVTGVNDMILTPNGIFNTSPQDTIIAMKHPEDLSNEGARVSVIVNNYGNDKVETSTDDKGNLIIDISRKISQDFVTGENGWEKAHNLRQNFERGLSFSL